MLDGIGQQALLNSHIPISLLVGRRHDFLFPERYPHNLIIVCGSHGIDTYNGKGG